MEDASSPLGTKRVIMVYDTPSFRYMIILAHALPQQSRTSAVKFKKLS